MKNFFPKELLGMIPAWADKDEDFVVGKDNFSDLQIEHTPQKEQFYYFYDKKKRRLIKQFVLSSQKKVDYICRVNLIKKDAKFTPRLAFSVRDKLKEIVQSEESKVTNIKANVNLDDCHENFWKLIRYLDTVKEVELPRDKFSLVSQDEEEIIAALRKRGIGSVVSIIKQLSSSPDVLLTQKDVNSLLKRREKLAEFESALEGRKTDELWWSEFFEQNKWIFGYGLNYQILRQQQSQPNYGGTRVDGKGGQRGDNLMATAGDLSFTVLVEIKTPGTPLLQGNREIRSGAWSLSKNLIDALTQIQANIQTWDKEGSKQPDNQDILEKENIYTVKPRGIIVIGSLAELSDRHKRETLERFRRSIHGVEIISFDEVLKRAKFIVDNE